MAYRTFQTWLESKDIFGFDKYSRSLVKKKSDDMPIKRFSAVETCQYLRKLKVGDMEPYTRFSTEIHWGTGLGSFRVWFGESLNVWIDRQSVDLNGTPRWITKKIYQIDQTGGGKEAAVAADLYEQILQIHEQEVDSAKNEYDELESLVISTAEALRRVSRDIFHFEGVRKVSKNNYIIRMTVRGHGLEDIGHKRVEENQTQVSFDENSGVIRLTNFNIESRTGRDHNWALQPADADLNFMPTQSRDEIVETIACFMHWY